MIKIKITEIEVNKDEFTNEVKKLCSDLHKYLDIHYLYKERFNEHFKTKLNDLEFAKLMANNLFEIQNISNGIGVRINIEKLLNLNL